MKRILALILILIISIAQPCLAEIIRFKSGQEIDGEIIEKSDKIIKIKHNDAILTYSIDRIESFIPNDYNIDQNSIFSQIGFKDFANLLQVGNYTQIESKISEILSQKNISEKSDELTDIYIYMATEVPGVISMLNDWCDKSPSSYIPWLARGTFYVYYAWDARGTKWASSVAKEKASLFKERLKQAQVDLEKAYQLNPEDPNAAAQLINVAMGLGLDYDYMETQFQRAIRADPNNFKAHRAKLLYLMPKWHGSAEKVSAFVKEVKSKAPEGSRLRLISALAYYELYYGKERKKYFQNPQVWNEINADYAEYFTLNPDSMREHNYFALYAFTAEEYEITMKEFGKIVDNWDRTCWGTKDYFYTTKRMTPGLSYIKKGMLKNAEDYFFSIGEVKGIDILIKIYREKGNYVEAERLIKINLSSGKKSAYSHLVRGLDYEKNNQLQEAFLEYKAALEINPEYGIAYLDAAHVLEKLGNIKQAVIYYQKAVQFDPQNSAAYYDLARMYEDVIGEHNIAIAVLKKSIELNPNYAPSFYLLGKAYENIDDHDNCFANFETYLRLDPNGQFANFVRKYLNKKQRIRLDKTLR